MHKLASRSAALLLGALLVASGVTCADSSTAPKNGLTARVGVAPVFSEAATDIYRNLVSFELAIDNVHVVLLHANGAVALDTVVTLAAGQEEVVLVLNVSLAGTQEQLVANIELRDGTEVLFAGTQLITARVGSAGGSPTSPPIELTYAGPGATVTSFDVQPDTSISAADVLTMRAVARNSNNQAVTDLLLNWSIDDATMGSVTSGGVFQPSGKRGTAVITAELPTGLEGSATVTVVPVPTALVLISGGGQTGTAGAALGQPFVVEVRASDNLPVAGFPVGFAVASGGGSVAPTSATTDADGRASTTLTLGTTAGTNSVSVTALSLTAVSVSATGIAGPAAKLAMVQQPSATTISGVVLQTQPSVQLLDANGNAVSAASIAVFAQLSPIAGRTLQGTTTRVTNASGVAEFTDLKISGPPGTTALTFVQEGLSSVTSSDITVTVGAPASVSATSSLTVTDTAGANLAAGQLASVIVKDAANSGVAGVEVKFRRRGGAGSSINSQPDTLVLATSDANGAAALSGRRLQTVVGFDTVLVTVAGLNDTLKFVANVTNASAKQLVYTQEPANSTGGAIISPAVVIEVRDQFGNRTTTGSGATSAITLGLSGGTAGATLGPNAGAVTQAAIAGLATFNVSVDKTGTGYSLGASAAGSITAATSSVFNVTLGPPAQLTAVSGNDAGALPGDEIVLQVQVADAGGNVIPSASMTFTVDSGGGTLDSEPGPVTRTTNGAGTASVDWRPGSGPQKVIANVGAIALALRAYVAEKVVMVTQPSLSPQSGVPLVQQPSVRLTDNAGNLVRRAGAVILADFNRVPEFIDAFMSLTGTMTANTNAEGIATFTDLTFTGQTIQNVELAFYALGGGEPNPAITPATSPTIVLQPGPATQIDGLDGFKYFRLDAPGTQSLTIVTRDGYNNVPGASVTFSVVQGSCTLANPVSVTTDASGQGTVSVNTPPSMSLSSCVVRAQVNLPPPEGGGEVFVPQVYQRVYVAPLGAKVWTGASSTAWNSGANWYNGDMPSVGGLVFVPGASEFDNKPSMTTGASLNALVIESGANLTLSDVTLTLSDSLAAVGPIVGAGSVVIEAEGGAGKVRGDVQVELLIGNGSLSPCQGDPGYTLTGPLTVLALKIYCTLTLDTNVVVTVSQALSVFQGGRLEQTTGSIIVSGDATFSGTETLVGGLLELHANATSTTDCEGARFQANGAHVTRLAATAVSDTARFALNDCVSSLGVTFGILEIATRGKTARFTSNFGGSFNIGDLLVRDGGSLVVTEELGITAGGAVGKGVTVEEGGVLTNLFDRISVPLGVDGCVVPGTVINGPFSCVTSNT